VQLRAHGDPVDAVIDVVADPAGQEEPTVVAALRQSARGVAPGQALVVYDGTRVVGSATIVRSTRTR
jgi:tRNA-uridine 2-sulfurtransferase